MPEPAPPASGRRRVWRLLDAAAAPWLLALAAVGAVGLAFAPHGVQWAGGDPAPAGPFVSVTPGPDGWRLLLLGRGVRPWFLSDAVWWEQSGGLGVYESRLWVSSTRGAAGVTAAPGRSPDVRMLGVAVPWVLSLPLLWSVLSLWRAASRAGAASPLSPAWRAVRPWAAALAVVGAGLLTNGLTVPDDAGRIGTVIGCDVGLTPPGAVHPRVVRGSVARMPLPVGFGGVVSSRHMEVGFWWFVLVPAVCNVCQAVADRRSRRAAG